MTTTTVTSAPAASAQTPARRRTTPAPIPFTRILGVEMRKMFDTRSGFWLMASVVLLSVVATGATIIFGDRDALTYEDYASAVGIPMAVILPMMGVLAVTSEWSQRTALTTFTLVPSRSRVVLAKLVDVLLIGAASMVVAMVVGALGNLIAASAMGVDATWNIDVENLARIVLANEIGMLIGFVLGLVIRNSPAAIVGYFVVSLVLPGVTSALASNQEWWRDNGAWFDLNEATWPLFDSPGLTGEMWAHLGTAATLWLIVPGLIGWRMMQRAEVK